MRRQGAGGGGGGGGGEGGEVRAMMKVSKFLTSKCWQVHVQYMLHFEILAPFRN